MHKGASEADRQRADDLIGLLTPVIKGYFTDKGFENASNALQCLGGHGYIREWGLEQFVRDSRIAMIYEGTNGIQALDLVGRKLALNGGRALRTYLGELRAYIETHAGDTTMNAYTEPLARAVDDLQGATSWLMHNAMTKPENAGAGSAAYMHLMGLVSLAYMWAQIAQAAHAALDAGAEDRAFYDNKLTTARYFFSHVLPETAFHRTRVEAGAENIMALDAAAF